MTAPHHDKSETTSIALSPVTIAVNMELETWRKKGAHILQAGVIQRDIPLHDIVVTPYQIELVPDGAYMKSPDKEVYASKGEFSLTRVAYDRFAQRACIQWVWRECMRIPPFNNPRYCAYRAVGKMMDLSGRWRVQSADKAIDMDIAEQELRDNYTQKALDYMAGTSPKDRDFQKAFPDERDRRSWVEEKVRADGLQIQKHILSRAQTGAQNRVVQKLLALKSSYTKQELEKPFVFAALVFRPDPNHPMDRRHMLDQGSGMADMMYGQDRSQSPPDMQEDDKTINVKPYPLTGLDEEDEAEIVHPSTSASASPPNHPPQTPTATAADHEPNQPNQPSPEESMRMDFASLDVEEQARNLDAMIKIKAYKGKINGDIAKWKPEQRMQFYDMLSKLPTPGKSTDDLPFDK
ncbi:MAG: hypothetical protein Q7U76_12555 [Nitrospirota bacterium]|nr:hypothetical protein [Nitrospirota bacterium]